MPQCFAEPGVSTFEESVVSVLFRTQLSMQPIQCKAELLHWFRCIRTTFEFSEGSECADESFAAPRWLFCAAGSTARQLEQDRYREHSFILSGTFLDRGNRLVISGVGDCRVVLLEGEGKAQLVVTVES